MANLPWLSHPGKNRNPNGGHPASIFHFHRLQYKCLNVLLFVALIAKRKNMDLPKRLYKYQPLTSQTLANLKNQVIYFGSPQNFNDPYDCNTSQLLFLDDGDVNKVRKYYLSKPDLTPEACREFSESATINSSSWLLTSLRSRLRSSPKSLSQSGVFPAFQPTSRIFSCGHTTPATQRDSA